MLRALNQKGFLTSEALQEIEECLKERDEDLNLREDNIPDHPVPAGTSGFGVGHQYPDKRQIEQRIEEDRERHKRLRESIWAVPSTGPDAEKWRLWEETSDLGEDDHILGEEEFQERKRAAAMSCPHRIAETEARERAQTEAVATVATSDGAAPGPSLATAQANGR